MGRCSSNLLWWVMKTPPKPSKLSPNRPIGHSFALRVSSPSLTRASLRLKKWSNPRKWNSRNLCKSELIAFAGVSDKSKAAFRQRAFRAGAWVGPGATFRECTDLPQGGRLGGPRRARHGAARSRQGWSGRGRGEGARCTCTGPLSPAGAAPRRSSAQGTGRGANASTRRFCKFLVIWQKQLSFFFVCFFNPFLRWSHTCVGYEVKTGGEPNLVISEDKPINNHILEKVSSRALHWYGYSYGYLWK